MYYIYIVIEWETIDRYYCCIFLKAQALSNLVKLNKRRIINLLLTKPTVMMKMAFIYRSVTVIENSKTVNLNPFRGWEFAGKECLIRTDVTISFFKNKFETILFFLYGGFKAGETVCKLHKMFLLHLCYEMEFSPVFLFVSNNTLYISHYCKFDKTRLLRHLKSLSWN